MYHDVSKLAEPCINEAKEHLRTKLTYGIVALSAPARWMASPISGKMSQSVSWWISTSLPLKTHLSRVLRARLISPTSSDKIEWASQIGLRVLLRGSHRTEDRHALVVHDRRRLRWEALRRELGVLQVSNASSARCTWVSSRFSTCGGPRSSCQKALSTHLSSVLLPWLLPGLLPGLLLPRLLRWLSRRGHRDAALPSRLRGLQSIRALKPFAGGIRGRAALVAPAHASLEVNGNALAPAAIPGRRQATSPLETDPNRSSPAFHPNKLPLEQLSPGERRDATT